MLLLKGKVHSKDELHQWDELKQNQLEGLLEQHWNPRGDTFTQPAEGYSLAEKTVSHTGEATLFASHWAPNSTSFLGTNDQSVDVKPVESKNGMTSDDNKTVSTVGNVGTEVKNKLVEGGDGILLNQTGGRVSHTSGFSHPVTQNPQAKFSPTAATSERVGRRFRPTKEPNPEPREQATRRDNKTPEEVSLLQAEKEKLEQEREELLLLHKRLDQEKEILKQQQMKRGEEERQKGEMADSHHHLHGKHHHHLQTTKPPGKNREITISNLISEQLMYCRIP